MFFLQSSSETFPDYKCTGIWYYWDVLMAITLVSVVVFHQRRVIKFNKQLQKLEEEKQQMLLKASISFQEEERQRIAADFTMTPGHYWPLQDFTSMKILFTRSLQYSFNHFQRQANHR